ncbi:tRNA (adenosine(37)-N6)-threonylcarbamoyltransferase complex ATPase subunit type 1 TsaE [Patescibacteria group bacterium]|nr:tRNA (adenosine(37)-N6)-threonylcarbamoyltransferase complex ATPase subunit type 1 TsaE [Patescibacteria group bacterium]
MIKRLETNNDKDTKRLAKALAEELTRLKGGGSVVLGLVGELGSGKTTFTQGLLKALGVKKRVLSPTFVIQKRFKLLQDTGFKNAYHIDAYRIEEKDLIDLGWKEILLEKNIVVVEWADRVKKVLPKETIWIKFNYGGKEHERKITINRRQFVNL